MTDKSEFEIADARAPVETARRVVVLLGVPEGAVINRIHRHVAVIAPTVNGVDLGTRAVEEMSFTLSELFSGSVASRPASRIYGKMVGLEALKPSAIFPRLSIAILPKKRQVVSGW